MWVAHLQLSLRVWSRLPGKLGSPLDLLQEGASLPPLVLLECGPQQIGEMRDVINVCPLQGTKHYCAVCTGLV